jgi:hypothetical protein
MRDWSLVHRKLGIIAGRGYIRCCPSQNVTKIWVINIKYQDNAAQIGTEDARISSSDASSSCSCEERVETLFGLPNISFYQPYFFGSK